jgi:hypothetical protein
MKNLLRGYYHLDKDEFKEIWEKCIFVFDTNALLNLYRYPTDTSDEFISVLNSLKDRIWLPHYVALEYQNNRINVIQEQVDKFDDVKNDLNKFQKDLENKFISLKKRHSIIDPTAFLEQTKKIFSEFEEKVDNRKKELPNFLEEDSIRQELDKILTGKSACSAVPLGGFIPNTPKKRLIT